MNNYKYKHTKEEIQKIYDLTSNRNTQNTYMSILAYYKKYSVEGELKYSVKRLFSMYQRTHKISQRYFYKLINKIREVFYKVQKIVQPENKAQSIDTTKVEGNTLKHNNYNNNIYNTNTNIIEIIKNLYKGISGAKYATKKDLIDITKSLLVVNNVRVASVQAKIFSKIHNSKQKIQLAGAVAYINALILDKLSEYDSINFQF